MLVGVCFWVKEMLLLLVLGLVLLVAVSAGAVSKLTFPALMIRGYEREEAECFNYRCSSSTVDNRSCTFAESDRAHGLGLCVSQAHGESKL